MILIVKRNAILIVSLIVMVLVLFAGNRYYNNKINSAVSDRESSSPIQTTEEKIKYSSDNIFIYSFNGVIQIYVKGSNEESNKYIGYQIKHSTKELNKNENSSNYDIWNLNGAHEYQRNGEDLFMHTANVVTTGEWELAIFEENANDFIGGLLHGDEITTDIKMIIDGEEVDPTELIEKEAKEVQILTTSELYRDNTITNDLVKLGIHQKQYTFNKEGVNIEQDVTFDKELTLKKSYLAMLPILRKSEGVTGSQVTDTAITNYDDKEYDVSKEKFDIPELRNIEADKATVFSEKSGFSATVEVVEKSSADLPTEVMVSDSESYNKIYFSFNNDGYVVNEGDVWEQTTKYHIDTIN